MIQIKSLDHVVLRAVDADAMIRFYCDVLGCPVERTLPPELGLIQLRAGSALIDIVPVDGGLGRAGGGPPGKQGHNMDHFCLQVNPQAEEDISRYLASHGIEAGSFERRYGAQGYGNSLYLHDPEGNIVELRNRIQT